MIAAILLIVGLMVSVFIIIKIEEHFEYRANRTLRNFRWRSGNGFVMVYHYKQYGLKHTKSLNMDHFMQCEFNMSLKKEKYMLNKWYCTDDKLVYCECDSSYSEFLYTDRKLVITREN